MNKKTAIIIGAGPAGLTAAYELLKNTDIKPIIFEMDSDVGGLAKTVDYKGNKMDIGGHRFFSKSDIIIDWWLNILPLQSKKKGEEEISYQGKTKKINTPNNIYHDTNDNIMLLRKRKSRIYFLNKFFPYPLKLNWHTLRQLGFFTSIKIFLSFIKSKLLPRKEKNLEDFFINRFGETLYNSFFKSYTEKVWGIPCSQLSAEWGRQRIKELDIGKAILHQIKKIFLKKQNFRQKKIETSLIEKFLYPKYGPGHMWKEVEKNIKSQGGEIFLKHKIVGIDLKKNKISSIDILDIETRENKKISGDYFISTMPVKELISAINSPIPDEVRYIGSKLTYRNFITIGILLKSSSQHLDDNWLYIQDKDVKVGRIQIFNNWSPYLVKEKNTLWIGLEYFCNEGDALWKMTDDELENLAIYELEKITLANKKDVLDSHVVRVRYAYPSYSGSYKNFNILKNYIDGFENLFLIGRNGMHKYNNQDHSMLTAMAAVENIKNNITSKDNIWAVNTEEDYHEKKSNNS